MICLSLIKISLPYKSFPIIGSPPLQKVPPADNLPVKIRPSRAAAGRGGFLPVNCRPGKLFWGAFYNGAPAVTCRSGTWAVSVVPYVRTFWVSSRVASWPSGGRGGWVAPFEISAWRKIMGKSFCRKIVVQKCKMWR